MSVHVQGNSHIFNIRVFSYDWCVLLKANSSNTLCNKGMALALIQNLLLYIDLTDSPHLVFPISYHFSLHSQNQYARWAWRSHIKVLAESFPSWVHFLGLSTVLEFTFQVRSKQLIKESNSEWMPTPNCMSGWETLRSNFKVESPSSTGIPVLRLQSDATSNC